MDGRPPILKDSLQFRLSLWLSAAILGIAIIGGVFAFLSAFREAHELQDDVLRQVATLFERYAPNLPQSGNAGSAAESDAESRVFVQLIGHASALGDAAKPVLPLPDNLQDGLQTVEAGHQTYRVLVRSGSNGQRFAVAQETALRDEIARDSALRTLMPFLILVPLLLVLVAHLVRKIFRPVAAISSEIDRRSEQELHPIAPEALPAEIRPFVGAINRLLSRVDLAMDAQKRFIADAAHELRSPLTALSLQAERLAEAEMSDCAGKRLGTLRSGIERGRILLDQLLTLARAQAAPIVPKTAVSVVQVFRQVLEDLMPLAEAKDIDLGVASDNDALVIVEEMALVTLIKNLVDNAIRYTPAGGRIDLSVQGSSNGTTVQVEDNGPGIPIGERARVFDPFYRVLGSDEMGTGLGLSIVQAIASRCGARVCLEYADVQSMSGLRVSVVFPAEVERAATVPGVGK